MDSLFGQSHIVYVGQSLVPFKGSVICTSAKEEVHVYF